MPRHNQHLSSLILAIGLVAAAALPPTVVQAQSITISGTGLPTKGSGKVVEQDRHVAAFSRIRLEGSFEVHAQQGGSQQVSARADDNLIDFVETVVVGNALVVRNKAGASWQTRSPMVVKVTCAQLDGAQLKGSGDLTIAGLRADRFRAELSGSGDLRIKTATLGQLQAALAGSGDLTADGSAEQVDVQLAGSGDVELGQLISKRGTVKLLGSGDVTVHTSESVNVMLGGSGDVRVYGKPRQVTRKVAGSGDIHMK